jgi:hypothetical protein
VFLIIFFSLKNQIVNQSDYELNELWSCVMNWVPFVLHGQNWSFLIFFIYYEAGGTAYKNSFRELT